MGSAGGSARLRGRGTRPARAGVTPRCQFSIPGRFSCDRPAELGEPDRLRAVAVSGHQVVDPRHVRISHHGVPLSAVSGPRRRNPGTGGSPRRRRRPAPRRRRPAQAAVVVVDGPPKTTFAFGSPALIAGYAARSRRVYAAPIPSRSSCRSARSRPPRRSPGRGSAGPPSGRTGRSRRGVWRGGRPRPPFAQAGVQRSAEDLHAVGPGQVDAAVGEPTCQRRMRSPLRLEGRPAEVDADAPDPGARTRGIAPAAGVRPVRPRQ